jgi:hypothetical protein
LVLLCSSHHTLVHEGKLSVRMHAGKLEFRNASGLDHRRMPLWDGARLELDVVVSAMLLSERCHGAGAT